MSISHFYSITEPIEWAKPPQLYSYSKLLQIEQCPRAWQLLNSRYEGFERYPAKPSPAGIEGQIVHLILEKIFKTLACKGMPKIGTSEFQNCLKQLGVMTLISELVTSHNNEILKHPRGSNLKLKSSVQEIHNKIIRIFREQYDAFSSNLPISIVGEKIFGLPTTANAKGVGCSALLEENGILTEFYLQHPDLPLHGIIDFIWRDGNDVLLSDFKSGLHRPEHIEQVKLYSLLWYGCTGQVPAKATVVYPDTSISIEINKLTVESLYSELKSRISRVTWILDSFPATANYNIDNCKNCSVRQLCDEFWESINTETLLRAAGMLDIQVSVHGQPGEYGFIGRTGNGANINVVYDKSTAKMIGHLKSDNILKILGGFYKDSTLEIKPWSEVFHC